MGCGSSHPESPGLSEPQTRPRSVLSASQPPPQRRRLVKPNGRPNNADSSQQKAMSSEMRQEFLHDVHAALYDVPYVVIGGSALAEYGNIRETAGMDVLVGGGCSKYSATELLVTRTRGRVVRRVQGGISYIAPNGILYSLNLSTDDEMEQPFDVDRDTELTNGARLGTLTFLLNSKAHAWQTRHSYEPNYKQKRENDATDIAFCLENLRGKKVDHTRLKWVYSRAFWKPFLADHPHMEILFKETGLWVENVNLAPIAPISVRSRLPSWTRKRGTSNGRSLPETILEENSSVTDLPNRSENCQ